VRRSSRCSARSSRGPRGLLDPQNLTHIRKPPVSPHRRRGWLLVSSASRLSAPLIQLRSPPRLRRAVSSASRLSSTPRPPRHRTFCRGSRRGPRRRHRLDHRHRRVGSPPCHPTSHPTSPIPPPGRPPCRRRRHSQGRSHSRQGAPLHRDKQDARGGAPFAARQPSVQRPTTRRIPLVFS
jgi:hypothetical protein